MINVAHAVSKLAHDLEMVFYDGSRHVLRGIGHVTTKAEEYTYNLPADGFHRWLQDFKEFGPVANGSICEHTGPLPEPATPADADQQAVDQLADRIEQQMNS